MIEIEIRISDSTEIIPPITYVTTLKPLTLSTLEWDKIVKNKIVPILNDLDNN